MVKRAFGKSNEKLMSFTSASVGARLKTDRGTGTGGVVVLLCGQIECIAPKELAIVLSPAHTC